MNHIKNIFQEFFEFIIHIFKKEIVETYKLKNPCPTCIVRPCCDSTHEMSCRSKRNYLLALDGYRAPYVKKAFLTLYLLWFCLLFVSLSRLIFGN